jgi:hypothetical protein
LQQVKVKEMLLWAKRSFVNMFVSYGRNIGVAGG